MLLEVPDPGLALGQDLGSTVCKHLVGRISLPPVVSLVVLGWQGSRPGHVGGSLLWLGDLEGIAGRWEMDIVSGGTCGAYHV